MKKLMDSVGAKALNRKEQ